MKIQIVPSPWFLRLYLRKVLKSSFLFISWEFFFICAGCWWVNENEESLVERRCVMGMGGRRVGGMWRSRDSWGHLQHNKPREWNAISRTQRKTSDPGLRQKVGDGNGNERGGETWKKGVNFPPHLTTQWNDFLLHFLPIRFLRSSPLPLSLCLQERKSRQGTAGNTPWGNLCTSFPYLPLPLNGNKEITVISTRCSEITFHRKN